MDLNLDHDERRSLHRVVRAMHDGECPHCHTLHPSEAMRTATGGHECPTCGFEITKEEVEAILGEEFGPFMERNLEVFRRWRATRRGR